MVWLLNSQGMKNCKSTESFCRSILAIYTNDWSIFDMFTAAMFIFFSRKFLNMCKFRTTTCPLWQAGPPGIGILLEWAIMINKLAGDGVSRLALFHAIINFLPNEIYDFSRLSHETTFLLGQPASYSATLDHEITLNILEFILNSIEKVKPGFSFSSMCMFPELNETKS